MKRGFLRHLAARIAVAWHEVGLPIGSTPRVRDLWEARDLGRLAGPFVATVRLMTS